MADLERGSPPPLFADSDNEGNDDVLNASDPKSSSKVHEVTETTDGDLFPAIKEDHQPPAPYGDIPVVTAKEEIRQSDPPSVDADKSNLFDGDSEIHSKDRISKENNNESLVAPEAQLESSLTDIEILVSDPKKIGDGMNAYVVYKVSTRTNLKFFKCQDFSVNRRFSDFLGLHEKLVETYQSLGKIIPPPPEKSVIGMTKVKMTKDDTGSMDFVEKRRAALERFLMRIARHPELRTDDHFIAFLELDGDLPKATSTSTLSSAGIARLFGKVGESINKMTFTMSEPDQWFEDKIEQIEAFEHELKELHTSVELLVLQRRDLALSTGQFAKCVANLGSTEEHMSLSKVLSQLSEVETTVERIYADQADTDFFVFSELIKDYIMLIQSLKEALNEREKLYKMWKDAETLLLKKQELKTKMEQQKKFDKVEQIGHEISECEEKVAKSEQKFDEISKSIKKEISIFEKQRTIDFRSTIINYLQIMMNNQQQLASCWELFLPNAKVIV